MQEVFSGKRLQEQDKKSDTELEIILDTRAINEIDQSKAALHDIIRRIEEKKNILLELEDQMDNVSSQLMVSTEHSSSSFLEMERKDNSCSTRVGRTQDSYSSNRPREGDARITSPKHKINMASTMESEKELPSQGALGSPRDRHGGEPDAAGSTVDGRESSEGTAGVGSVSAPAAQAATAEPDSDPNKGESHAMEANNPDAPIRTMSEKRKAAESPDGDTEGDGNSGDRRFNKARAMELSMDNGKEETITIINERSERLAHVAWQKENLALKKEIAELKEDNCRQSGEINQLKKMISELTREVRSLRESLGYAPTVIEKFAGLQSTERRREAYRDPGKGGSEDGSGKEIHNRENTYLGTDVEIMDSTPGCSADEVYMSRKKEWSNEEDALSWSSRAPEPEKEKTKELVNKNNLNISSKMFSKTYNFSNKKRNSPNATYFKKINTRVSSQYSPYKRINIIENRRLVPPFAPSSVEEGENIGRKKIIITKLVVRREIRQRYLSLRVQKAILSIGSRTSAIKSGKSLVKPTVVTITSRKGDATYAEILRSARESPSENSASRTRLLGEL